ncbi:MAG TPA: glycosyltransferase [bacterium]|nr:glycosyltransferase [bacterium]
MRVGIFTDAYKPQVTGVVNSVVLLRRSLEADGHEVAIVAPVCAGYVDTEPRVFRYPAITLPARVPTPLAIPVAPRVFRRIAALQLDVIHSQHPFSVGRAAAAIAARLSLPLVYTFHTQYEQYAHYVPLNQTLVRWMVRRLVAGYAERCDVVVCPAPSVVGLLRSYGIRRPVEVVHNGIDLSMFARASAGTLRARLGIAAAAPVAIFAGRLAVEKNLDFLLQAFRLAAPIVPTARLLLVGDGADRDRLRRLAGSLDLDGRVHFAGAVPYAEIPAYYAAADLFVMSSVTEVRPLAILEAMAVGLPVLGLDAPGAADTVTTGVDGVLVSRDAGAFARALAHLLDTPGTRRGLGANARVTAGQYSIAATARRLAGIYSAVRGQRAARRTAG